MMQVLLGSSGLVSANSSESQAAIFSLETAMRVLPDILFPTFIQVQLCNLSLSGR